MHVLILEFMIMILPIDSFQYQNSYGLWLFYFQSISHFSYLQTYFINIYATSSSITDFDPLDFYTIVVNYITS